MPVLFRAYGQIRRGSAAWRTPFLIPTPVLAAEFPEPSHVSIDTGGSAPDPDLQIVLTATSIDHYPSLAAQFRIRPYQPPPHLPQRPPISDITVRLVLLMEAEGFFVDDGLLEDDASYVVIDYRVPPGRNMPSEVRIDLLSEAPSETDPRDSSLNPVTLSYPFPPGMIKTGRVGLNIVGNPVDPSGGLVPFDIQGGIVTGTMVRLNGVQTTWDRVNLWYGEVPHQIRGIPLEFLENSPPAGATMPDSATIVGVVATPSAPNPRIAARISIPATGPSPLTAPTTIVRSGGSMRPGTYRYRTVFLQANGCESAPSPQSAPVEVTATDRTVRITDLPTPPPAPVPDDTRLAVTAIRVYRTDGDRSTDPADAGRGGRGDDVFVSEVAPGTMSVDDTGPTDPTVPPRVRPDYLAIVWDANQRMDVSARVRMLGDGTDERYRGSIRSAPMLLRAVYRPGFDPTLLAVADSPTPGLSVEMPDLELPFGTGLYATIRDLPTTFALRWSSLGSDFFGLSAAGDRTTVRAPGSTDPAVPVGRAGIRFGPTAPPSNWPDGDAHIAAELDDQKYGTAGGLIALSGLRRASVRSGGEAWSQRDLEQGSIEMRGLFAPVGAVTDEHADRTIRFRRRSGGDDVLQSVALSGHFVPDVVHARVLTPANDSPSVFLDTRLRFLRAALALQVGDQAIDGIAFVDDTTDELEAKLGDAINLSTFWPVRAGGTVRIRPAADPTPAVTIWPDVIVPSDTGVVTKWPITAKVSEPGVSGRVAVAFGRDAPVATRSTPQVKVMVHGDTEETTGLRAVTARLLSVGEAVLPESVTLLGTTGAGQLDVEPTLDFHPRSNRSFRVEALERERRVTYGPDLRAPDGARSWLRGRTSRIPDRLTPLVRWSDGLVGGELKATETWGEGVVWAEPSFVYTANTDELGTDRGIGLITAGWDQIPTALEAWLLDKGSALDGKVADSDRRPTVGSADSTWDAGGAMLRVDGALRLSNVHISLPGDARRACWNDNSTGGVFEGVILEPDRPVRYGHWTEVVGPFVKLEPTAAGLKDAIIWSAGEHRDPPDPSAPEPNPCASSGGGAKRQTAIGWHIHDELGLVAAVRLYELDTPSGLVSPPPRWWSMPTSSERWNGKDMKNGEWQLKYDVQMKDYGMATVAIYPDLSFNPLDSPSAFDNPFGDWVTSNGTFWIRARGILPLGPGDIYLGNVGGGFRIPLANGLFSTLPKIFTWSYP